MRTVIFAEGSDECPLVAIADFDRAEVTSLRQNVSRLASGEASSVLLNGDVQLALQVGPRDIGILRRESSQLSCVLSTSTWSRVANLLEPFTELNQDGFQWLDETGDVKLSFRGRRSGS
jgi:hypothetical protein